MGRPERNTVDYFPHFIGNGKKIFSIEAIYGNDGYAVWFKILEKLAGTDYHFLNLNDTTELLYLSARCKVDENRLISIIDDLCRLNVFDKKAWNKRIIWSQQFIESIEDVYIRRSNKCMSYEGLCKHLLGLGIQLYEETILNVNKNTQTKLNKTKDIDTGVEGTPSIDFGKFIEQFNSFGKRGFRVTEKVKTSLKARLKEYTKQDILKAIKNAHDDKYHIETNFKYLTPEFILRPDKLDKFLNAMDKYEGMPRYTPQNPL